MKIRLALIDTDEDYRKRLSDFYIKNYQDRIEILTFSSLDSFENNRGNKSIDVMLVSENIEDDLSSYSEKMSMAYLSDRDLIERKNNIKTINKFKKPEKIYKEILNVLVDGSNGDIAYKFNDGNNTLVEVFMPVNGGAGATSLAIAYAKRLARRGIPTLYLNFEILNSSEIFLNGDGNIGFDEIIYAIKSKKQSVSLKIESSVLKTSEGLNFFNKSRTALDMLELSDEDISALIKEIKGMGKYRHIIIDCNFDPGSRLNTFSKFAYKMVFVFDDTKQGIKKMSELNEALHIMENNGAIDITNKMTLICNKVKDLNNISISKELPVRDFVKNYSADSKDLTEILSQVSFLENLR